VLGQGGFGVAYLASDQQLVRRCVVKQLCYDSTWDAATWAGLQENFAREAQLLVSLNSPGHPNIPEIYEYLPAHDALVMKHIQGRTLQHVLKSRLDPLPDADALRYARAVCAALVYMHSRAPEPVLHRDIKPANLLLDAEGRVWVIDFGLAEAFPVRAEAADHRRSQIAGTLGYTPPEQWRGTADPRSDVYALGATLATLLGADPHGPATGRGQQLRPALTKLIARATAEELNARPLASELLAALDELLDDLAVPPPPAPSNIPQLLQFVGREAEQSLVWEQLTSNGVALLLGMPGVGKTALAAALATQASTTTPVFWHTFHSGDGFTNLLWQLATFCAAQGYPELWATLHKGRAGGPARPPAALINYLLQTLDSQRWLLCLDDLQLAEDDPDVLLLLRQLIAACSGDGLILLVTSRHAPPDVSAELCLSLNGLKAADAALLIEAYSRAVSPTHATNLAAITEGNPQLLLMATTALHRSVTPTDLLNRLAIADDLERYLLVEVDGRLDADEQAVMGALAALLGYGGTHDAVAALLERPNLRRTLFQLRRRSLLVASEGDLGLEYRQHSLVQAFYYQLLGRRERQALHRRAGRYYEREEPDALRAARHYWLGGESEPAARLATAHSWALINRGRARELLELLEQFSAEQLDPMLWSAVCAARGDCAALLGDGAAARSSYEAALATLAELPDGPETTERRAHVYHGLGQILEREAPTEALALLRLGLAELAGRGLPEEGLLHLRVGSVLLDAGDFLEARAALEQSLSQLPASMPRWRARALTNIGIASSMQGDLTGGRAFFTQALALYEQAQDHWGMVAVGNNIGKVFELEGRWPEATRSFQRALGLAGELGSVTHLAELELSIGTLQTRMGAFDHALAHLTRALELACRHTLKMHQLYVYTSLADLHLRVQEWEAAAQALDIAEKLAQVLETRQQLAELARCRAQLLLARGLPGPARAAAEQSLAVARELEAPVDEGAGLRMLALVLDAAGERTDALALLAESRTVLAEHDPYELARSEMEHGILLAATYPTSAVALLEQAKRTFTSLGARQELATAVALLQQIGEPYAASTQ